ncbi:hypothetical protein NL676_009258 [Syzygium grande]|nr:hypothetical protein NL676_009258 [Syzygium grande]
MKKVEDPDKVRLDTEVGDGKDASPVGGAVLEEVPSVDESQSASIDPEDVSTIDQSSLLGKNEEKVEDPAEVRLDTEVGDGKDASPVGAVLEEVASVDESQFGEEDNVRQCSSDDENKVKSFEKAPADAVESTENLCQRQAACASDTENKFKSIEKAPADAIESTENLSQRRSA